ncbi:MAG: dihydroorotase [Methanobacteriaceae archaeon]|nr:dihydroorotase [Methanobacteriaceae archaeon]MDO9627181.1 dihydroorotase [Methanobacteriaceae archaeon]
MIDLCIQNCKISSERNLCSISINQGKIVDIGKTPSKAEKTIDAKENLVLPGLIDVHVHFRDPGLTYKEDFKSGSHAAANGGFTTILDMPNTVPPTNTAKNFQNKLEIASKKSIVDFGLHAGVSDLKEIEKIAPLSPASFKIFMDTVDGGFLKESFKTISELSIEENNDINIQNNSNLAKPVITLHAENKDIVNQCTEQLKSKEQNIPSDYTLARPSVAEEVAVAQAIALTYHYQTKTHFCHVSTQKSLDMINSSKSFLNNISAEITPQHLFLDSSAFKKFGNLSKTNPPLRKYSEKVSWENLSKIDLIGTDHAPHSIEEKKKGVWDSSPGIPNLEVVLKLLLSKYHEQKISLDSIKRLLCENPAKIFNLKNKGFIKIGMDADIVIIDLKREGIINSEEFYSKGHYTPFEGMKYHGAPIMTICRGNLVMENNDVYQNQGIPAYP